MRKTIVYILMALFLVSIAIAVPQTVSIQLDKVKSSTGTYLNQTHNVSFKLYKVPVAGAYLYEKNFTNKSFNEGYAFFTLDNVNLTGASQYYLGVNLDDKGEISPRTNVTSVFYAFRSNFSEYANNSGKLEGQIGSYYLDDSNASSICDGEEVLLGNGSCYNSSAYFDDTNQTNASIADMGYIRLQNTSSLYYLLTNPLGFFNNVGNFTSLTAFNDSIADWGYLRLQNISGITDTDTNCSADNSCPLITYSGDLSVLSNFTDDVGYFTAENNLTELLDDNYADISVVDTDTNLSLGGDIAGNINMSQTYNITDINCIKFFSGGKICSSS